MKHLWTYMDKQEWSSKTKYIIASLILGIPAALAGYLFWLIVRIFAFSSWDWMICFTGYPFVFAWLYAFRETGRHDFHDGSTVRKTTREDFMKKNGNNMRLSGRKSFAVSFTRS